MSDGIDWGAYVKKSSLNLIDRYLQKVEEHAENTSEDFETISDDYEAIQVAIDSAFSNKQWSKVCRFADVICATSNGYLWVQRQLNELISRLRQAIQAAEADNNQSDRIAFTGNLTTALYEIGERQNAREAYLQLLDYYRRIDDSLNVARAYHMLGLIDVDAKEYDEARQNFQKGLDIQRAHGYREDEARALHQLGSVAHHLDDYQTAREYYQASCRLKEDLGLQFDLAHTLTNLAEIEKTEGGLASTAKARDAHYAQALRLLKKTLHIHKNLNNPAGLADAYRDIGALYNTMGVPDKARHMLQISLKQYRRINHRSGVAADLLQIGVLEQDEGNNSVTSQLRQQHFHKALRLYKQSLRIAEDMSDPVYIATIVSQLGVLYRYMGNDARSKKMHEKSLSMRQQTSDREGIAFDLFQLGLLEELAGDNSAEQKESQQHYASALEHYQKSLAIREGLNDVPSMASVLSQIGILSNSQGNLELSREMLERSLAMRRELNDRGGIATDVYQLAHLQQVAGDSALTSEERSRYYANAHKLYNESRDIYEKVNDQIGLAGTLGQIALLHMQEGDFMQARKLLHRSLEIYDQLNEMPGVAFDLLHLGLLEVRDGESTQIVQHRRHCFEAASNFYRRSKEIYLSLNKNILVAQILAQTAILEQKREDYDRAEKVYREAIEMLHTYGDEDTKSVCLVNLAEIYETRGVYNMAEPLIEEAVTTFARLNSPNIAEAIAVRDRIAGKQGRINDAIKI